jgi:hypothetical protein
MAKGKLKRRRAGKLYQPGYKRHYKKVQTPAYLLRSSVAATPSCSSDVDVDLPVQGDHTPVLRPKPDLQEENGHETISGNRVINLDQMCALMNNVYNQHNDQNCGLLDISICNEHKHGLGSQLTFKCKSCGFISSKQDTYQKCPDSRAASINMLVASALQDTAIGIEKANLLFTSMDIPPVSRSHMQTLVNKACINTIKLNNDDMAEKRQLVIEHNRQEGQPNPHHLDLSFDGRYNSNRFASSYKPGHGASQAYGVAIENNTDFNYVVGLAVQNKLCWTGAYMRNKGFDDVTCPGGHVGCTSTLPYMTPHSEREMAKDIAEQLSLEDILVRTLTTDGDTKAHLGMQDFYGELGNAWSVGRQADPHHLGSIQFKRTRSCQWSKELFGGEKLTSAVRQQATRAFAQDVKARSNAVIEKLRITGDGDLSKVIHRLPDVRAATIECYAGNCSLCPQDSLVCAGQGGRGDWWYQSNFLPTHGIRHLKMTTSDRELLSAVLEIRLSESAVRSVQSNTSTQKCEAFNRAALSVMPKDINMSRNFAGSLASKTLQLNNTLQESVEKKVSSITGQGLSTQSSRYLRSASRRSASHRTYQKTVAFKTRRKRTRARLENEYHRARTEGQAETEIDYVKGQMVEDHMDYTKPSTSK